MPARRRVAIYVRLSLSTEESVSIARQIEACRKYAEARDWEVVVVLEDDGVSATKNKPEDRPGWKAVLKAVKDEKLDAVVVWKIDRLARRVMDFLNADAALQERGAGLVAVEDPIDMTTAQGRAFAVMLAVFAELEAASISARSTAARGHLLRAGRAAGGWRPWPYALAPSTDGAGVVWEPIPERAALIRDAAERLVAEKTSIRALAKEWTEAGVPTQYADRGIEREADGDQESTVPTVWDPTSLKKLLKNPALAGATVYRGDVLRHEDGTIRRDVRRMILEPGLWKALQDVLDQKAATGVRKGSTRVAMLAGLVKCGSCGCKLYIHWDRERYVCHKVGCPKAVSISAAALHPYVAERLVADHGAKAVEAWFADEEPDTARVEDLREALEQVRSMLDSTDDDEAAALVAQRRELRALLAAAETEPTYAAPRTPVAGLTVAEWWDGLEEDAERRLVLSDVYEAVVITPGAPGRHALDESRVAMKERKAA